MDTAPNGHALWPLAEYYCCTPVPNCKLSLKIGWSGTFRILRKFTADLWTQGNVEHFPGGLVFSWLVNWDLQNRQLSEDNRISIWMSNRRSLPSPVALSSSNKMIFTMNIAWLVILSLSPYSTLLGVCPCCHPTVVILPHLWLHLDITIFPCSAALPSLTCSCGKWPWRGDTLGLFFLVLVDKWLLKRVLHFFYTFLEEIFVCFLIPDPPSTHSPPEIFTTPPTIAVTRFPQGGTGDLWVCSFPCCHLQ